MLKPLERFYFYLVKIVGGKINKRDAKNKKREAELAELFPDGWFTEEDDEKIRKMLGVPPLDAKNPYRFL